MKEYISREAALDAQNKSMNLAECRKRLERLPAADVVEVVRCGECKRWEQRNDRDYGFCSKQRGIWLNSDYCFKGERKDGGQDK